MNIKVALVLIALGSFIIAGVFFGVLWYYPTVTWDNFLSVLTLGAMFLIGVVLIVLGVIAVLIGWLISEWTATLNRQESE